MSKYGSKKTTTIDGITHDSKKEAGRWQELLLMERGGIIEGLRRQVPFTLIEAQTDESGKTIERECRYVADFFYVENGSPVVEDVKGYRTEVYRIKRKLMLERHGIRIREV